MSAAASSGVPDGDAQARPAAAARRRILGARVLAPLLVGMLALGGWELALRWRGVPPYVLPGPLLIAQTLVSDWGTLSGSLWVTLQVTLAALLAAVVTGVGLAVLFTQSRWLEFALLPYAVVLQVTPVVAIAPLIIIWTGYNVALSLLICAWLVAFFPILSNTILGLNAADHNLRDLFELHGATRWQTLRHLRLPAALPYFLGGLRISAGLALIGAVVAEFVAGTGGAGSGLAFRILEAGHQLKIPRLFAALAMISMTGVALFLAASFLSWLALRRWHESAVRREG